WVVPQTQRPRPKAWIPTPARRENRSFGKRCHRPPRQAAFRQRAVLRADGLRGTASDHDPCRACRTGSNVSLSSPIRNGNKARHVIGLALAIGLRGAAV